MSLNVPVIFGMKLKKFRELRGMTLTEFAAQCDLSPVYIADVEKGRKYPNPDKIHRLAEALGRSYEDLVSPRLTEDFAPLEMFLNSPVLKDFPFHLFGISLNDLVELVTRSPAEASALLKALLNIANNYHLEAEHLFRAALRAYQESKLNYFEDVEEAVEEFDYNYGNSDGYSLKRLQQILEQFYNCEVNYSELERYPELMGYRSVYLNRERPKLLINPMLNEAQRRFILAREIGYQFLGLNVRAVTSAPEKAESFEQVLNDFKASYFAGALLIERNCLLADLEELFSLEKWDYKKLIALVDRYKATPELLFYRISELIPRFFGIKLHFLRYNLEAGTIKLIKQLHAEHLSAGLSLNENHCRRWLVLRYLKKLARDLDSGVRRGRNIIAGAQISNFIDQERRFLCLGIASRLTLNKAVTSSVAIGLQCDDTLERRVRFLRDKSLARLQVGTSCERCPMAEDECQDRVAPATILIQLGLQRKREETLRQLLIS